MNMIQVRHKIARKIQEQDRFMVGKSVTLVRSRPLPNIITTHRILRDNINDDTVIQIQNNQHINSTANITRQITQIINRQVRDSII